MYAGNGIIGQSPLNAEMTDRLLLCPRFTAYEQHCHDQGYYANQNMST